jgi:maltose-binding protein MalE
MFASRTLKGKLARLLPTTLIAAMVLAACGGTTATPVPPTATTGAEAPTATTAMAAETPTTAAEAPTATTAMAAETPTEGTTASGTATVGGGAGGDRMVPTGAGSIVLWHGYTGVEAETLTGVINDLQTQNADFKVEVLAVPFDQLQNKFTTEASTGGGPDLLIGPSDWIGQFADASLVQALDDVAGVSAITGNLLPAALNVSKYDGKLYGLPVNMKNVALYYNKDIVKTLPKDTEELLTMASSLATGSVQYGFALNTGFYNAVGYNFAYGGKLFTDPKTVDLTQQGTIDWLTWLKKARDTKGVLAKGDADIDNLFKTGAAGMVINGPWALGDYQKALGADKVGVAVAPSTPGGGKFAPFVGTENYFLNANSENTEAAVAFLAYISSPGVQQQFVQKAGHISTNTSVDLGGNEALQAFVDQAAQGSPFPNFPAMGKVWDPAGNMINEVLDGLASPADAAKKANDAINSAIQSGGSSR